MRVEEWELERKRQEARSFLEEIKTRNKPWQEWYYKKQLDLLNDAVVLYRIDHRR